MSSTLPRSSSGRWAGRSGIGPPGFGSGADLAHHQDAVLGLESFSDEAVDEAVAVEMRGVDVVDAQLGRTPQESDRRAAVVMETLELHRAVADPRNGTAGE